MWKLLLQYRRLLLIYLTTGCILYIFYNGFLVMQVDFKSQENVYNNSIQASFITDSTENDNNRSTHRTKLILLLGYQRVGSTFIGQLFDGNKDMAYIYEPLDGLFTHLYGTDVGWSVPSDIHYNWDATPREIPEFEKNDISLVLEQFYNCDHEHVITEQLLHPNWDLFSHNNSFSKRYMQCIRKEKLSVTKCRKKLAKTCPQRVGENLAKQLYCKNELSKVFNHSSKNESFWDFFKRKTVFQQYEACLAPKRQTLVKKCLQYLTPVCRHKRIRVIKTVRISMDIVQNLLRKFPHMKVIHLIRDPRPVVLSRFKVKWATLGSIDLNNNILNCKTLKQMNRNKKYHALPRYQKLKAVCKDDRSLPRSNYVVNRESKGFAIEAKTYCQVVLKDIEAINRIEEKHPGTTLQVKYENIVGNLTKEAIRMYSFINETIPHHLQKWIASKSINSTNRVQISKSWQKELPLNIIQDIDNTCKEVYSAVGYNSSNS